MMKLLSLCLGASLSLASALPNALNQSAAAPYGNPAAGCAAGETAGKVAGMCVCLPACTGTTCPAPGAGVKGKPVCDVSKTGKPPPTLCTLGCTSSADCPTGGKCTSGICGFDCGGPAPPPPPGPPGPAGNHWANPGKSGTGCSGGDSPVHFPDASHECCLPKCTGTTCPAAPTGTTGVSGACDVSTTGKPPFTYCSLNCQVGKSACPTGATCVSVGAEGVCTYPNSLEANDTVTADGELFRIPPQATLAANL